MKKFIRLLALCILPLCANAQTDSIRQRIFLVGDAGGLENGHIAVIDWLNQNVDWNDSRNLVVFLGDNVYEEGLPLEGAPDYPDAKKTLDYQINLLRGKKSKGYFILGNHDWKGGMIEGWQRAVNEVNYINAQLLPNVSAHPNNGCPGPVPVEISDQVVLVLMDSQWFLHLHDKPGLESTCGARTVDEFTAELRQIVLAHPNQLLILAMHHPLYTYGAHGGAYPLRSHIFPLTDIIPNLYIPLPGIGSIYPVARGVFGTIQDSYHPLYRTMRSEIETVLKEHPNAIAAAGHEHSMQLIEKDSIYYIVSGSGSRLTRLRKGKWSIFSLLQNGFAVLEVSKSGKTEVKYYSLQSKDLTTPVFKHDLKPISTVKPKSTKDTLSPLPATITIAPNPKIRKTAIKQLLFGKNYRREWLQPVTVPVLDIGKEAGGLKPVKETGSMQSRALWLEEKTGRRWILRPVGEVPIDAIPADLRQSSSNYTVEAVTGVYPYADLSVTPLLNAANVPAARTKLVYVPDDPRFERYRSDFKSTLAILEEEQPARITKTISTDDLYLLLAKDNRNIVNQKRVLQTRLLENFVMDFDRNDNQYVWASYDTGAYKAYYPIPRDHQQAFFLNEGIFPRLIRMRWFIPQIQGFREKASNIKSFNYQSRNFDRAFLNGLSQQDWEKGIDTFLAGMSDDVLKKAVAEQPTEIQAFRANEILQKLRERRAHFKEEMLEYFRFLALHPKIVGSNEKELFRIDGNGDKVIVAIYRMGRNNSTKPFYERDFDKKTTNEILLYGLEGDDSFKVTGPKLPMRVRIVGGPGHDAFAGDGNAIIYDVAFDSNKVYGNNFSNKIIPAPENNMFNRQDFRYDFTRPAVWLEYNADDGFKGAALIQAVRQGFRKLPYAYSHLIAANYASYTSSFTLSYAGDYRNILLGQDVVVNANLRAPYTTNFFGYGNDVKIDLSKPDGLLHYRASYSMGDLSVYTARQLQSWMRVGIGPAFQFINVNSGKNAGRFVSEQNSGTGTATKLYSGLDAIVQLDSRNNEVVPTRGAFLKGSAKALFGLNSQSNNIGQIGLDLRLFLSFIPNTPFVLATRIGVGHNFGAFEFPQAQYLSGTENLRGYRRQRFAGRTMMFNNTELRLRLTDFNTYLFRGAIGILAFHDIGKVVADNEGSAQWHNGYGGGLWYSPVKRSVVVASFGFSPEEKWLPQLSFGFQF